MDVTIAMKLSDGSERIFPLRGATTVIGRASRCEIRVPLPSVSDRHCELCMEDGRLLLKDLCSDAGTFLNGERVTNAAIMHADELTVGSVNFTVRIAQCSDLNHSPNTIPSPEIVSINRTAKAAASQPPPQTP